MRVLLLGGGGFVGQAVARQLVERNHDVRIFRRTPPDPGADSVARTVCGDLAQLQEHQDELRALHPDVVIHLLAMSEADAKATIDVFRGFAGRCVALSSQDVYAPYGRLWRKEEGEPESQPLPETSRLRSQWFPYRGMSPDQEDYEKILVERALQAVGHDLPTCVLRLGMVHGEGDPQQRLYEYARRIEDGRPAILLEKSRAAWRTSRCYVDNCATAIVLATTDARAAHGTFNVSEPEFHSEQEWVNAIGRAMGWNGQVVVVGQEDLPPHLNLPLDWRHHLMGDSTHIRETLGYAESIEPEEGLLRTIDWQRGRVPAGQDHRIFDYDAEDAVIAQYS